MLDLKQMVQKDKKIVYKSESLMIIISSPSGAGKTTIAKQLLEVDRKIKLSVSLTTREKRTSEVDGVDYQFIGKEAFEQMAENGQLLEYARVFGQYYGTPKAPVEHLLTMGHDVLFDIDWQGAQQISSKMLSNVIKIFILPPNIKELENRLKKRGLDSEEVVMQRMKKAKEEISHYDEYDYVVVNYDVDEAMAEVRNIIEVERMKRTRLLNIDSFITDMLNS